MSQTKGQLGAHDTAFSFKFQAFWFEFRAFLAKYMALLFECRFFLAKYRALLQGVRTSAYILALLDILSKGTCTQHRALFVGQYRALL